jgi:hypothetical protein
MILRDGTIVEIGLGSTLITLPSGATVPGAPHDTNEYRGTARRLGYGGDTTAMCRDHDPVHALLADWLGLTSYSLRQAAGEPVDARLAAMEEDAVLAVQKYMRHAGGRLPIR